MKVFLLRGSTLNRWKREILAGRSEATDGGGVRVDERDIDGTFLSAKLRKPSCDNLDTLITHVALSTHVAGYDNRSGCALTIDRTETYSWDSPLTSELDGENFYEMVGGICGRGTVAPDPPIGDDYDDTARTIDFSARIEFDCDLAAFGVHSQITVDCEQCREVSGSPDCINACGFDVSHDSGLFPTPAYFAFPINPGTYSFEDTFDEAGFHLVLTTTVVMS